MKKMSTKFNTAIKVVGYVQCLSLFMFNIVTAAGDNSGFVSFNSLKAYADNGVSGSEEEEETGYTNVIESSTERSVRYTATQICIKTRTCFWVECVSGGTEMCAIVASDCGDWSPEDCFNR